LLAACGGQTGEAPGVAGQPARQEVTLEWLSSPTAADEVVYRKNLDSFEATHSPTKVALVNGTSAGGWQPKLETMIAGGTPPDAVWHGPEWFPGVVSKGFYRPLDAYLARQPKPEVADFIPRVLEQYLWEGKQYGVPTGSAVMVLFYNKDLFDKEGLSYPDGSWTFEGKYLDAARRLAKREGERVVQYGVGNPHRDWIWPYAGGADYLDKPGKKVILQASPESARWFQFAGDLRTRHRVAPTVEEQGAMPGGTRAFFLTGQVGMEIEGNWTLSDRKTITHFTWDAAPVPMGSKARPTPFFSDATMVCAGSKHPDEAFSLAWHLGRPEAEKFLSAETGRIPALKSLAGFYTSLDGGLPPRNRKAILEALDYAQSAPPFRYFRDFTNVVLAPLMTALNQGTINAQEMVAQMTPQLEALVQRP
jgi:multiple sugar transport system substrate-binding protein